MSSICFNMIKKKFSIVFCFRRPVMYNHLIFFVLPFFLAIWKTKRNEHFLSSFTCKKNNNNSVCVVWFDLSFCILVYIFDLIIFFDVFLFCLFYSSVPHTHIHMPICWFLTSESIQKLCVPFDFFIVNNSYIYFGHSFFQNKFHFRFSFGKKLFHFLIARIRFTKRKLQQFFSNLTN